jgi:hypothetical protein
MRRPGIAAAVLLLVITAFPTIAVAQAAPKGNDAFCSSARELQVAFKQHSGLNVTKRHDLLILRRHVRALAADAPKQLATSLATLLRFYGKILRGEISLLDSKLQDAYGDVAEAAAPASMKIAKYLARACGVSYRG